jgi:hypothetical protein
MKPNIKNAVITVVLLSILAGGLFFSMRDRQQEVARETQQVEQDKRAAAVVDLSGLIALDIEQFFKDSYRFARNGFSYRKRKRTRFLHLIWRGCWQSDH